MKYRLDLSVSDPAVKGLLGPGHAKYQNSRSTVHIEGDEKETRIRIEADDPVALQASINGIINLMRVDEAAKGVIDEFS
ncbi:MAG: hypothetical protein GXP63_07260 [DPANN group archaeon]|nr:hypothetical protein [DPANN group archaeon]